MKKIGILILGLFCLTLAGCGEVDFKEGDIVILNTNENISDCSGDGFSGLPTLKKTMLGGEDILDSFSKSEVEKALLGYMSDPFGYLEFQENCYSMMDHTDWRVDDIQGNIVIVYPSNQNAIDKQIETLSGGFDRLSGEIKNAVEEGYLEQVEHLEQQDRFNKSNFSILVHKNFVHKK